MENNSYNLHKLDIPKTTDLTDFSFDTNETRTTPSFQISQQNNIKENGINPNFEKNKISSGPIELHGDKFTSRAQELYKELIDKRALDSKFCQEFEATIRNWSDDLIKEVVGHFAKNCDDKMKVFQRYFADLTGHLEDVCRMETELQEIQNKVESLYKLTRG
jgi:hypothetical protein